MSVVGSPGKLDETKGIARRVRAIRWRPEHRQGPEPTSVTAKQQKGKKPPPRVRHRRADLLLIAVFLTSDLLMLSLAMLLAYGTRLLVDTPWVRAWDATAERVTVFHPVTVYLQVLPIVLLIWIVLAAHRGLYTPRRSVSRLTETMKVWKTCTLTVLFGMAGAYLSKYDYSRSVTILFFAYALVLTSVSRLLVRKLQLRFLKRGFGTIRTLVYGTGEAAMMVVKKMQRYPQLGYRVAGFIDDDQERTGEVLNGGKILGTSQEIVRIVRDLDIHEVFIAQPFVGHEKILALITRLESEEIRYRIVSDLLEALTARIELDGIANIPIVDLKGRRQSFVERTAKAALDYTLTTLILVPALPLMGVIAVLIKLDSAGPIFFRQERVGFKGRIFKIFKFRTMHTGCDRYEVAPAKKEDPRVTRVGRFLRRTSLDELPQLLNVLTGDMSLVGPRPEMPFLVKEYEPWQLRRLDVKPGITGLWQILGRKDLPLHDNLEYDFYYIQNRSLAWDLLILVKTLPIVLFGKGAY